VLRHCRVDTEEDRRARAAAAEAAAKRQERFDKSAVGKAVKKSVKAARPDQRYEAREAGMQDYIN